jgi:folate/biopterin transporter
MRSNSPRFQLVSKQAEDVPSVDDKSEIPLTFVPSVLDLDNDGELDGENGSLVSGGSSSDTHNEKLTVADDNKEAVEGPLIQKVTETGDSQRDWLDLRWAVSWLCLLNRELNGTFVFGVMVVYGFGQGFGGAITSLVVDYYWKDIELAQPAAVQLYRGFSAIPWDIKPIWGLLTDTLPLAGYHRRPYFLLTGIGTVLGTMVLVTGGKLWVPMAVGMLVLIQGCAALSDATIDAEVAKKSREKPSLAADIQSLCAISISVGSLVGFAFSGFSVDLLGSDGALGLLLLPASLLVILGFVLHEERDLKKWHPSQLGKQIWNVTEQLWATLKQARVWKPTLYMYLCIALSPDISEGKFYWYTGAKDGPGFSDKFVGAIYATGSIGTLAAVYFYHKKLKRCSFRKILLWVQLLVAVFGMLDLILVTRFNKVLHIPDDVFVVGDEGCTQAMSRLKWMPLLILAAKLCPPGIEGTFFAFLMSVDNVGLLTSSWLGAILLRATGVTRDNFELIWLAVTIRNILRLVPMCLVFLLPDTDPEEDIWVPKEAEESIQLVVTTLNKK